MRIKRSCLHVFVVGAIVGGCVPQHRVHWVDPEYPIQKSGIYYALPKTVVTVTIPVTKVKYELGPLGKFAAENGITLPDGLKERAKQQLINYNRKRKLKRDIADLKQKVADQANRPAPPQANTGDPGGANAPKQEGKSNLAEEQAKTPAEKQDELTRVREANSRSTEVKAEFSRFSLGTPVITTRAEPDRNNVFLVEIKGDFRQDRDLLVELTENGLLTSAESKATDKTVDYIVKTIGAVAKTYSAAGGGVGPQGLDTKKMASASPQLRPRERAKHIAEDIRTLRERRLDMVSAVGMGHGHLEANTLDRMLTELAAIEEELMSNFRKRTVSSWTATYEYTPYCTCGIDCTKPVTLFFIDAENGLIPAEGVKNIPETFTKNEVPSGENAPVKIRVVKNPEKQFADIVRKPCPRWRSTGKHGFFYRIPATGRVTVEKGEDTLAVKDTLIAQFGAVAALPPGVKSTSSNFLVSFHEETGALKKAQVSSKAIDPALIEELGDAAAQIASAQAARRAAKAAEPSGMDEARAMMENCAKMLLIAKATGQPLPAAAAQCLGGAAGGDTEGEGD